MNLGAERRGWEGAITHPAHALLTQALTSKFASENSAGLNDIAPAKHGPEVPRSGVSQGRARPRASNFWASPSEARPLATSSVDELSDIIRRQSDARG